MRIAQAAPHKAWATKTIGAVGGKCFFLLLVLNQSRANTPPSEFVTSCRLYLGLLNHFRRTADQIKSAWPQRLSLKVFLAMKGEDFTTKTIFEIVKQGYAALRGHTLLRIRTMQTSTNDQMHMSVPCPQWWCIVSVEARTLL